MQKLKTNTVKYFNILIITPILLFIFIGCQDSANLKGISEEIYEVIFEKSKFSIPITRTFRCELDSEVIERYKKNKWSGGLSPIPPIGLRSIPKPVREQLIQHNFLKEMQIALPGDKTRTFYKYTDKIKPYIYKIGTHGGLHDELTYGRNYADDFSEARYEKCIKENHYFAIKISPRVLESIDYTNQYEDSALGVSYDAFAVRFSYTLKKNFPLFTEDLDFEKTYKGEAKAYKDPAFEEWKLLNITLEK